MLILNIMGLVFIAAVIFLLWCALISERRET
jgi:hypothetical protein